MVKNICTAYNVAGNDLKTIKTRYSVKCRPRIRFIPSHSKVLDIYLRTKEPVSDIYRGLPVHYNENI